MDKSRSVIPVEEYKIFAQRSKENILNLCRSNDPYFRLMCEDDRFWKYVSEIHFSPDLDLYPFNSHESLVKFIWNGVGLFSFAAFHNNKSLIDYLLNYLVLQKEVT